MTPDPWACITPADRAEIEAHAHAIGCVYVAAQEHHTQHTFITWARLYRTAADAARTGVDETTIQQTIQIAKETS